MPLAAISIKSWSGTVQNLHGSALVQRAQCHVSHEQRPARFSLLSSERAKGSLIVSSAQVYSKYSSSDYKRDRRWSTPQCYTADEQCHNSKPKWGWTFLSKLILNIKLAPSEYTPEIKCFMPKFFNIHMPLKCIFQKLLLSLYAWSDTSTDAGVEWKISPFVFLMDHSQIQGHKMAALRKQQAYRH